MRKQIRKEGLLRRIIRERITNRKLLKNKLYASILVLLGIITMRLTEGDCTVLILMMFFALPVFFNKENVIN